MKRDCVEIERYLERRRYLERQITSKPSDELGLCVVIPAHDEPDVGGVLASLWACERPQSGVEILVVVNASEHAAEEVHARNHSLCEQVRQWGALHNEDRIQVHLIEQHALPRKHAGVGLARKIGMDEAAARFAEIEKARGVIACLDADCTVASSYLCALERCFQKDGVHAASIYYEHPIEEEETILDSVSFSRASLAICLYELFLRYYIHVQRWVGLPFAYQTVGSSMAVHALAYARQGGMNKRQAGEDFYFLQKLIRYGGIAELMDTKVIPSARCSHRVPFGTGRAMSSMLQEELPSYETYPLEVFALLGGWLPDVWGLWGQGRSAFVQHLDGVEQPLRGFLEEQGFVAKMEEIQGHASSVESFRKRFWDWFDAFMLMKWAHYARENGYPLRPVVGECQRLFVVQGWSLEEEEATPWGLLRRLREIDRGETGIL
ncbi:MAG: glycosyltransferase [Myxococcales bacterium]|nr:glycosyltransferase [Myxococcales bacterium]